MKLYVFERKDWRPYVHDLVVANGEKEARSYLEKDKHYLCDVYDINEGMIGTVEGG